MPEDVEESRRRRKALLPAAWLDAAGDYLPEFIEEYRRQGAAVAAADRANPEEMAFLDALVADILSNEPPYNDGEG